MPGYRTWATNDVVTASDMNELHADPLQADVTTGQSTTSTGYTDLATVGPQVTKTLVAGQKVWVEVSCFAVTAQDGTTARMSFAVSGASTQAATDVNAARFFAVKIGTNTGQQINRATIFTATSGGSHTFTAKYRSDGGNSFDFHDRRIIIKPY